MVDDVVFVAASSTQGGTVTVKSGNQAVFTQDVEPGVQMVRAPMGVGEQTFEFTTKAGLQASGKSTVDISDKCWVSRRRSMVDRLAGTHGRKGSTTTTSTRARSRRLLDHPAWSIASRPGPDGLFVALLLVLSWLYDTSVSSLDGGPMQDQRAPPNTDLVSVILLSPVARLECMRFASVCIGLSPGPRQWETSGTIITLARAVYSVHVVT